MGSRFSCRNRDSVPDDHPTKFKVRNVNDDGVELGSAVMELTENELVLHLQQCDSIRWPYRSLRRYGYDSDLLCFESGRRCQTGQGLFAFKCSRAKEIFNLLEDWMRRNSINVIKEPPVVIRNSHPPELDLPRGPLQPTGCPGEGLRFSAPRRPSTSSLRHPSLVEDSTRALIASNEQSHTYVNMPTGEEDHCRSPHCLQPLSESRAPFPAQPRGPDQWDPKVFLQPGQVKYVRGPTPAQRQVMRCQSLCPNLHDPPHNNNNEGPSECPAQPKGSYENVSGCENVSGLRRGAGWRPSPEESGWSSQAHHRATLPHYVNVPRLPLQTPTSPRGTSHSHGAFPVPLADRRGSLRASESFDFRRPVPEPPTQLNYIQVELTGWGTDRPKGPQNPTVSGATGPTPARSSDSYAVIDFKKTVALSNLRKALPRDDGTVRKTRHNSTDLPL